MLIYVCGIAGVGKTTICRRTAEIGISNNLGQLIKTIPTASIIRELVGTKTEKEYSYLPENQRRIIRPDFIKRVYILDRQNSDVIYLFDRHLSSWDVKSESFKIWQTPLEYQKQVFAIAFITASTELICARRLRDYEIRPDRHLYDPQFLKSIQRFEKKVAYRMAKILQIPIITIKNDDEEKLSASQNLFYFVKRVLDKTQSR